MKTNLVKLLSEVLIGKKLKHINSHRREVVLEIESFKVENHSREITPSTRENDWWGETQNWTTYKVIFIDGSSKEISLEEDLEIEE